MNLAWQSWSEFFAMGGYGVYVWGSFGVTTAVMLGEIWTLRAQRRALVNDDNNAAFEGSPDET